MSDKYPGGFVTAGAPTSYSVSFDGSGDSLSVPSNAAWQFDSGNFTVEAWVYFNSVGNAQFLTCPVVGGLYWQYYAGVMDFGNNAGGSVQASWTPVARTWYHVAAVRNGATLTHYINGAVLGSGSAFNVTATTTLGIGAGGAGSFNGYFSNLRIVKGTAVYTAAFTPPTQLFAVSGTSLLTCQSPTIIDNSTNTFTITAAGDAKVSNFTPFAGYTGFNPALGAAAGGVWTLDEAAYYQNNRQWPIYDPYFNQTTLMLHGNGTNGAQNNTFLDSSTNNFTITRNGNTTQGTFTPFSQTGWSFYGPGNTNSGIENLQSATSSQYAFGTGDWCVEMWFYRAGDGINPGFLENLIDTRDSDVQGNGILLGTRSNGSLWAYDAQMTTAAGVFSSNTWNHVAYTRQNGAIRIIVNGILQAYNGSYTNNYTSTNCRIKSGLNTGFAFNGYVSNARVIKGNVPAQYQTTSGTVGTGVFTPPKAPLTVVPGTSLLTCQDGRAVDNSPNNFALTLNGTPSFQAFSPFVPAYITPTTYSNYFDGNGDYLNFTGNSNTSIGGNNWTVEAWVYITSASQQYQQVLRGQTSNEILLMIETTNTRVQCEGTGGTATSPATFQLNTWNHCAAVRNGSTVTVYLNGIGGTPVTMNPATTTSEVFRIGTDTSPSRYLSGCISNLRMVVGTAVYTSNFTPPTAPLTAISGTGLLTCQSSTFIDNSTNNFTITASGNVQPVTTAPFPAKVDTTTLNSAYSTSLIGGSAYFDGSGDYLTVPNNAALTAGTGDFTWEAWIYPTTAAGSNNLVYSQSASGLDIYRLTSGKFVVDQAGTGNLLTSTANVPVNAWTHYAFTRSGTTTRLFVNGSLDVSGTSSANLTSASVNSIGASGGSLPFFGYIAGLRFVKGSALYASSFATPMSPPTAVTNTQLLTNFTNGAIFDDTAKNVLETVGDVQLSTSVYKWGSSSIRFDGTGDALLPPTSKLLAFNTGDFTVELWVYPVAWDSNMVVIQGGSNGFGIQKYSAGSTGNIGVIINGGWVITDATLPTTGQWTHIAVARSGSTLRFFVNGVISGSTPSNTSDISDGIKNIGGEAGQTYFNGYMDDIRVTKGVARYVANFTPPTSALQNQ